MNDKIQALMKSGYDRMHPDKPGIAVGMGTCGIGNGADQVYAAFEQAIKEKGLDIVLHKSVAWATALEPLLNIYLWTSPVVLTK